MKSVLRIVITITTILATGVAAAANIPSLAGRITDNAGILSASMRDQLTDQLKAHEERTGNQIAVLTVLSLEGESIEEYAEAVFRDWRLGQKGKDNGVLLVVASQDRRIRIEVGYGLEGTLTDLLTGRIIRNVMTPRFKTGDYDGGIEAGISAMLSALDGGEAPDFKETGGDSSFLSGLEMMDMTLTERLLIGSFIFGILGAFTLFAIIAGGVGWFVYLFLIPFWAMFPIPVVGFSAGVVLLIIYLIGVPIGKRLIKKNRWFQGIGLPGRDGMSTTSFGSSSSSDWSGSSDSSSDFSGGGGESGGGGSSDSY